jgi:hypothetical protein
VRKLTGLCDVVPDFRRHSTRSAAKSNPPASEMTKALNHTNSQWTYVFRPEMVLMWPTKVLMEMIVLFSEIFQVTGPIRRTAALLAGHGEDNGRSTLRRT